jgi:hypothetical protein
MRDRGSALRWIKRHAGAARRRYSMTHAMLSWPKTYRMRTWRHRSADRLIQINQQNRNLRQYFHELEPG